MPDISPLAALSEAIASAAARVAPSVVEVASHRSLSSGFVWRPGLIVTADERLAEEGKVEVEFADGRQYPASLVGRDATTDLAVLRVDGVDTTPLAFEAAAPAPGSLTLVAAAAESAPLVALGGVAAVGPAWRSMRGGQIDSRIELDLRLRRRAEGGVALDATGRPYGMAVRGRRGLTLVIPAATIERVAAILLEHGEIPRGYLGLGMSEVEITDGGRGILVMSVDQAGPGAAAGILQGDIICLWNGDPVPATSRLLHLLDHEAIGMTASLSLIRGGAPVEASVTIGTRPRG